MTKEQFDAEFIRIQKKLLENASFLMNDEDFARDLVQKTYCLGIEKLESYKERGLFLSWLSKIMRNAHFSEYKRKKRREEILVSIMNENITSNTLDYRYLADANIFIKSRQNRLKLALNNIPFKYQRALKLKVEDNLSYRQIALREKIKYGTVKSRISRGKRLLRKSVNEIYVKTDCCKENTKIEHMDTVNE